MTIVIHPSSTGIGTHVYSQVLYFCPPFGVHAYIIITFCFSNHCLVPISTWYFTADKRFLSFSKTCKTRPIFLNLRFPNLDGTYLDVFVKNFYIYRRWFSTSIFFYISTLSISSITAWNILIHLSRNLTVTSFININVTDQLPQPEFYHFYLALRFQSVTIPFFIGMKGCPKHKLPKRQSMFIAFKMF